MNQPKGWSIDTFGTEILSTSNIQGTGRHASLSVISITVKISTTTAVASAA
ncbi:MAG TPA: hypothetical protein V6C86_03945 [Oculatellaceae cyanobacterium]